LKDKKRIFEMTNRELAKYVTKKGCRFFYHAKKHDMYINPVTGGVAGILRHWTQQVDAGTLAGIKKDLGIK
jgi:predicted RNA binding protein YcfA (HicA-like mRNA interferase family)